MKLILKGCAFEKHKVNMLYGYIWHILVIGNVKNC